jgi:hypothetical protein
MAQWSFCPTHGRLCEVGSPRDETPAEAAWRRYQEVVRDTIRERHRSSPQRPPAGPRDVERRSGASGSR